MESLQPRMLRTRNLHDDERGDVWFSEIPGALQAIGDTPNQMQAVCWIPMEEPVTEQPHQQSMFSVEDSHAKTTQLQETVKDWLETVAHSGGNTIASLMRDAPYGLSQRMSLGSSLATVVQTLRRSSTPLPNSGMASPGLCLTLNGSEWRNDAAALAVEPGVKQQTYIMRQREGKPGGGKGPLLSKDQSLTLAANTNDQTLFQGSTVRRLTPLECERLQGFPDNYTAIEGNSDSQRYRQLGNAVAVPVVEWIMRRITDA